MRKGDIAVLIAGVMLLAVLSFMPQDANAATKWNGPVQCSYYKEHGQTASGAYATSKSMGVAVPYDKVVKKKQWKKGSAKYKRTHFYYGERLELKHGKRTATVKVVDCGGFGYWGCYYKGKWAPRLFDLQVAVKKKLKCNDVDLIKWRVIG